MGNDGSWNARVSVSVFRKHELDDKGFQACDGRINSARW